MNASRMGRQMKRIRTELAKMFGPWLATAMVYGLFPERIGRYRILDVLVAWADEERL